MSASASGRSRTSIIGGAELPLHEGVPVEGAGGTAVEALLQFALQGFEPGILRDVAAHGFTHDFARRSKLARFDFAAGEIHEGLAEGDGSVLAHARSATKIW